MKTQCKSKEYQFQSKSSREIRANFSGGHITSDAGGLLLMEIEKRCQIIKKFSECFTDHRNPDAIEHTLEELLAQRIYAIALGYEDLNDHDDLRIDPLLATLVGKHDVTGKKRHKKQDQGKALASKSTLNRLELTPEDANGKSRYKKITWDEKAIDRFFVESFLSSPEKPPKEIVLDFDATDDIIHGEQEGRFFHGYYKNYCYLPLYIFSDKFLLCPRLRPSDIDGAKGSVEELKWIVPQIRDKWPDVRIIVRADSGFAREDIMAYCENNDIDYVIGLAKNKRLTGEIDEELFLAREEYELSDENARVFKDLNYKTLDSWSTSRRVVAKAEYMSKGENPRFVVTTISQEETGAKDLYEKIYCARGEMENRIKEQQLDLFADRTSSHTMRANQLRLWLSSVAYVMINELRRTSLKGTKFATAYCQTIRNKLFKIGALVKVTARKIWVLMASGCPYKDAFETCFYNLTKIGP